MFLKEGVNVMGIRSELFLGLAVAETVYRDVGVELVVTSLNDSRHSYTSLHYSGCAADLRTHNLPRDHAPEEVAQAIRSRLTGDYDVLVEGEGTPNEHIHIEYQPKRRD